MTTPTQAQIEAAAKTLAYHEHYVWGSSSLDHDYLREKAKAILTAAAQVGEQREHDHEINQAYFDDGYSQGTDATIERCAQVAADFDSDTVDSREIAAAIRKLKEEP
jgi:hypothetical protein